MKPPLPQRSALHCTSTLRRTLYRGLALLASAWPTHAAEADDPALHFTRPVVLLGEVHDNAAQHARRQRAFAAWLAQGARPALLMEQFDRSHQDAIDHIVEARAGAAGPADADAVIDAGAPGRTGWNWSFYKPFIELALRYRLPIVAANVGRDEARAVIAQGLPALGFDGEVPPALQAAQGAAVRASHCGLIDAAMSAKMAQAQVARDQFMARQVEANAGRGVLLLAGNGHLRNDIGVPHWLSPPTRAQTESIAMLEAGDDSAAAYDRAVFTKAQPRPDPCESMRPPR